MKNKIRKFDKIFIVISLFGVMMAFVFLNFRSNIDLFFSDELSLVRSNNEATAKSNNLEKNIYSNDKIDTVKKNDISNLILAKKQKTTEVSQFNSIQNKLIYAQTIKRNRKLAYQDQISTHKLIDAKDFLLSNWKLLPGVKAILNAELQSHQVVLNSFGNMVLVNSNDQEFTWNQYSDSAKSVVYDPQSNRYGYISGLIKIVGASEEQILKLQKTIGFDISSAFSRINVYYVNCDQIKLTVEQCYLELKKKSVLSEIEVVYKFYEKK